MKLWKYLFYIPLVLSACSTTTRKFSEYTRKPASEAEIPVEDKLSSQLRKKFSNLYVKNGCSAGFIKSLQEVAQDKIILPACPKEFHERMRSSLPLLRLEERSLLEELMNSQCQSIIGQQQEEHFINFVANYDSTGPLGRHISGTDMVRADELDFQILLALKENLQEIVILNIPITRWTARNGFYLVSEKMLQFFQILINEKSCKIGSDEWDGYQHIQTLDDLDRLLTDAGQREKFRLFLEELHKVSDEKVMQYFYP